VTATRAGTAKAAARPLGVDWGTVRATQSPSAAVATACSAHRRARPAFKGGHHPRRPAFAGYPSEAQANKAGCDRSSVSEISESHHRVPRRTIPAFRVRPIDVHSRSQIPFGASPGKASPVASKQPGQRILRSFVLAARSGAWPAAPAGEWLTRGDGGLSSSEPI
jgi:hypothetical protein